ncbi:hypothetical protein DL93DRAFT_2094320 [Clavulina sp. PMI_390]|nr:hypothetical protein DL93DRAFT_2094320 [Clavulina sp. PMI_390]
MPKRPKTPDSGPEEFKILAVYRPYPPNADLEYESEREDFVSWIVQCLGDSSLLLGIAWKPKSARTAIIYVAKSLPNWRRILGEHRWEDAFLPETTGPAFKDHTSQIFYCSLSTHRVVEKNGWKTVFFRPREVDQMFHPVCKTPYPPTTWCSTPLPDVTNAPIYNELPLNLFPDKPVPAPKPVVGSDKWLSTKAVPGAGNGTGPSQSKGAWGKPLSNSVKGASISASSSASTTSSAPSSRNGPASPPAKNAWNTSTAPNARSVLPAPRASNNTPTSSVTSAATTWSGTSVTTAYTSLYTPTSAADSDEDDEVTMSRLGSSMAATTITSIFDQPSGQTIDETAKTTVLSGDGSEVDLWAAEEANKKEESVLKCPTHGKGICNRSVCPDIVPYLKSLGLDYNTVKAGGGGPSNVYSLERERKQMEEDKNSRKGRPIQGQRGHRKNPASGRW